MQKIYFTYNNTIDIPQSKAVEGSSMHCNDFREKNKKYKLQYYI